MCQPVVQAVDLTYHELLRHCSLNDICISFFLVLARYRCELFY